MHLVIAGDSKLAVACYFLFGFSSNSYLRSFLCVNNSAKHLLDFNWQGLNRGSVLQGLVSFCLFEAYFTLNLH